jgi:hypothetical protein
MIAVTSIGEASAPLVEDLELSQVRNFSGVSSVDQISDSRRKNQRIVPRGTWLASVSAP